MAKSRQAVVNLVKSWEGKKESNGSHKSIIDLYNDFFEKICAGKFPRGIRMRYDWAWCACTWSALAAALRYESIMPMEISCYYLIEAAKKMGCWQENDSYVPSPGDAILYDWQDNGIGDNTGNPDHVGTVIEVHKESGYMVIEEGNYSNAVKKRTLSINGKFIRGFITPKYDDNTVAAPGLSKGKDIKTIAHEVIVGLWGSGENRKKLLTEYGYSYSEVQKSHRLNTLFSRSQALTVSTGIAASRERNLQNEDTNPNTGNSYKFVQNNYSPKALSRTEIYRQTKNQFSAMERMVET